jgi:formylglycine-generating enzyme required for sulfatase activity
MGVTPVTDADRLEELLDRWEELREAGRPASATELCRDCPELQDEFERRVGALRRMAWLTRQCGDEDPAHAGGQEDLASGAGEDAGPVVGSEPVPGYQLLRRLGRGGFGEVWRAAGPGGVEVALKLVPLAGGEGEAELRALRVVKDLRHPNLLALSGVRQLDGLLVLALEVAERTLLDRHREAAAAGLPGIPAAELIEYMEDAARGLDFLNGSRPAPDGRPVPGVQHRDVKPQNLLLVGGRVKVGDMGLARAVASQATGHSGALTLAYAAPEFFSGQTSSRSDQYSLAVTYCQMRGGRLPFDGSSAQVVAGHLQQAPDLSMLPAAERPAVAQALAKQPEDRWPTCGAFVEALRQSAESGQAVPAGSRLDSNAQAGTVQTASPQATTFPRGRAEGLWRRRGRALVAGVGGVVLAGLVILTGSRWLLPSGQDRPPAPPDQPAAFANSLGMRMMRIPAGKFVMGSPRAVPNRQDDEDEHVVEITRAFYMGAHEVTVEQFGQFTTATGYQTEAEANGKGWGFSEATKSLDSHPTFTWKNPGWKQTGRHPVTNVTLGDVKAFCAWLSSKEGRAYRLPTEAEWEYACRAGTRTPWYTGADAAGLRRAANTADESIRRLRLKNPPPGFDTWDDGHPFTAQVGQLEPNRFGLYDMLGNVWEWCEDRYAKYDPLDNRDPRGPKEGDRWVRRGGSWYDDSGTCRSGRRVQASAHDLYCNIGFRVVYAPADGQAPR